MEFKNSLNYFGYISQVKNVRDKEPKVSEHALWLHSTGQNKYGK